MRLRLDLLQQTDLNPVRAELVLPTVLSQSKEALLTYSVTLPSTGSGRSGEKAQGERVKLNIVAPSTPPYDPANPPRR